MPQVPDIAPEDIGQLIAEGGLPAERLARIRSERLLRTTQRESAELRENVTALSEALVEEQAKAAADRSKKQAG